MSREEPDTTVRANTQWKRIAIYAAVLVGVFLLGLIPMWLAARGRAEERDVARRELRLGQMRNNLASAAIESRRGEYEPARQAASDFFTALRQQVDAAGDDTDLTPAQRENLKPLLEQRDDLITLLARSDPASAERLSDLYVSYRKAMSGAQTTGGR